MREFRMRPPAPETPASRPRQAPQCDRRDSSLSREARAVARNTNVAFARVVPGCSAWHASILELCHRERVVAGLVAISEEYFGCDFLERDVFSTCDGHAVPGGRGSALSEALSEARPQPRSACPS